MANVIKLIKTVKHKHCEKSYRRTAYKYTAWWSI